MMVSESPRRADDVCCAGRVTPLQHTTQFSEAGRESYGAESSSFFCLAFFCLVGLGARNDGGTGPPAIAYYILLRSVQRLLKANVVAAELT
jgi:hypothetical protein